MKFWEHIFNGDVSPMVYCQCWNSATHERSSDVDHKRLFLFFLFIVLVQTTLITVQILRALAT